MEASEKPLGIFCRKITIREKFYLNAIEEAFVPQASVKSSLCRFCLDEKGMENIIYGVENRE